METIKIFPTFTVVLPSNAIKYQVHDFLLYVLFDIRDKYIGSSGCVFNDGPSNKWLIYDIGEIVGTRTLDELKLVDEINIYHVPTTSFFHTQYSQLFFFDDYICYIVYLISLRQANYKWHECDLNIMIVFYNKITKKSIICEPSYNVIVRFSYRPHYKAFISSIVQTTDDSFIICINSDPNHFYRGGRYRGLSSTINLITGEIQRYPKLNNEINRTTSSDHVIKVEDGIALLRDLTNKIILLRFFIDPDFKDCIIDNDDNYLLIYDDRIVKYTTDGLNHYEVQFVIDDKIAPDDFKDNFYYDGDIYYHNENTITGYKYILT